MVAQPPAEVENVTLWGVPCLGIATDLGQVVVEEKPGLVSLNEEAFRRGGRAAAP